MPPLRLRRVLRLNTRVAAALIVVPYWLHARLIDVSFSPIRFFSPADRMQLSDVPHGSSQTFALRVSPT